MFQNGHSGSQWLLQPLTILLLFGEWGSLWSRAISASPSVWTPETRTEEQAWVRSRREILKKGKRARSGGTCSWSQHLCGGDGNQEFKDSLSYSEFQFQANLASRRPWRKKRVLELGVVIHVLAIRRQRQVVNLVNTVSSRLARAIWWYPVQQQQQNEDSNFLLL